MSCRIQGIFCPSIRPSIFRLSVHLFVRPFVRLSVHLFCLSYLPVWELWPGGFGLEALAWDPRPEALAWEPCLKMLAWETWSGGPGLEALPWKPWLGSPSLETLA